MFPLFIALAGELNMTKLDVTTFSYVFSVELNQRQKRVIIGLKEIKLRWSELSGE